MSIAILLSFAVYSSALNLIPISPVFNEDLALAVINIHADSEIIFDAESSKPLKSISTNLFSYTLFDLSPYGYAIIANNNLQLMEACFEIGTQPPLEMNNTDVYYYVGPTTFAINKNSNYILVENPIAPDCSYILTDSDLEPLQLTEQAIASMPPLLYNNEPSIGTNGSVPAEILVSKSVQPTYFSNLNAFGNNVDGTCTVIASAILLGYYDIYVNTAYVANGHRTNATSTSSAGTNEAFHQTLCEYVYGNEPRGGIFIREAAAGINEYLDDREISINFLANSTHNVANTRAKVLEVIDDESPLIASMGTGYGANIDHTVVIYGYQYTQQGNIKSNPIFRTHYGWLNSPSYNNKLVSSSWFYAYGYIPQ